MERNIAEFKKELKELLEKYNVSLCVYADVCSDWHGISGERISVCDHKTGKEIEALTEYSLDLCVGDLME